MTNYDLVNKVYLKGTILSNPTIKFDKAVNENVLIFTLAVPRTNIIYVKGYNFDKYNYFYCVLTETNHTLATLKNINKTLSKMEMVEIKGCLDNRLSNEKYNESKNAQVNSRTLNYYVSTIDVLAVNVVTPENDDRTEEDKKLLAKIRESFGGDVDVTIKADAYDKNYFGFDKSIDLPDY